MAGRVPVKKYSQEDQDEMQRMKQRIAELEEEQSKPDKDIEFRVGGKGGVSVYGLGRFPVTLYYEQWMKLLGKAEELTSFMLEQKKAGKLKMKE